MRPAIVALEPDAADRIEQCAGLLHAAFAGRSAAWPDLHSARAEVVASLDPGGMSRVWLDGERVVGWIAGQAQYEGHVWELHPLVVAEGHRRRGIGRALVEDLELVAAARGGLTLWVGADDENGETSLAGRDLYERLPDAFREVTARGAHPYGFYHRLGFRIVGVMPDANGRGKPDIIMAKRIGARGRAKG
jgi:aminoglycoside 6'-N-acetyltransferase I